MSRWPCRPSCDLPVRVRPDDEIRIQVIDSAERSDPADVADEEQLEGVPELDRQERPIPLDVHGRPLVPQRVPETAPTPLQSSFIYLSIVVLVCGVIAIAALELGTPPAGSGECRVSLTVRDAAIAALAARVEALEA